VALEATLAECGALAPAVVALLDRHLGYDKPWPRETTTAARPALAERVGDLLHGRPVPEYGDVTPTTPAVLARALARTKRTRLNEPFAAGDYLVRLINDWTPRGSAPPPRPALAAAVDDDVRTVEAAAAARARREADDEQRRRRRVVDEELARLGGAAQFELALAARTPGAVYDAHRHRAWAERDDPDTLGALAAARIKLRDELLAYLDGDTLRAEALTLLQRGEGHGAG